MSDCSTCWQSMWNTETPTDQQSKCINLYGIGMYWTTTNYFKDQLHYTPWLQCLLVGDQLLLQLLFQLCFFMAQGNAWDWTSPCKWLQSNKDLIMTQKQWNKNMFCFSCLFCISPVPDLKSTVWLKYLSMSCSCPSLRSKHSKALLL